MEHGQKRTLAELASVQQCGLAFMEEGNEGSCAINGVCIIDMSPLHSGGGGWGGEGD